MKLGCGTCIRRHRARQCVFGAILGLSLRPRLSVTRSSDTDTVLLQTSSNQRQARRRRRRPAPTAARARTAPREAADPRPRRRRRGRGNPPGRCRPAGRPRGGPRRATATPASCTFPPACKPPEPDTVCRSSRTGWPDEDAAGRLCPVRVAAPPTITVVCVYTRNSRVNECGLSFL